MRDVHDAADACSASRTRLVTGTGQTTLMGFSARILASFGKILDRLRKQPSFQKVRELLKTHDTFTLAFTPAPEHCDAEQTKRGQAQAVT